MIITIPIGVYKQNEDTEIEGNFADIEAVNIDVDNIFKVFGPNNMNYDIFPKHSYYPKLKWTESEIIQFLRQKATYLENNLNNMDKSKHYDGLLVIISCHGFEGYIVSSDCRKISKTAMHRIFSGSNPLSREIPRIFIFDCCSGQSEKRVWNRDKGKALIE